MRLAILLAFAAVLSACSSGDNTNQDSPSITLSRVDAAATKATVIAPEDSIIDLNVRWQNWNGSDQPAIQVTDDSVTIVGDTTGTQFMVVGAHDYRIPLIVGAEYVLDVDDLSTDGAAAIIFPYVAGGNLISLTNGDGYAIATPGQPFRFTAPDAVAGFWIQVQNKWGEAQTDATIRPVLGTTSTPPIQTSGELIDLSVRFQQWQSRQSWFDFMDPFACERPISSLEECRAPGITVEGDEIVIAPGPRVTTDGYARRNGVQFYPGVPLSGLYELTVTSDTPLVSVYLVGLNQLGNPDLRNTAFALTTEGVTVGRGPFIASNAYGFAIQVQSPWVPDFSIQPPGVRLKLSLKRIGSDPR